MFLRIRGEDVYVEMERDIPENAAMEII